MARVQFNFSPSLSWHSFIQYDNLSHALGINSRFKWIIEPGNEFYFVVNQGFGVRDWRFQAETTELAAKVAWTLRF